nr:MAG TPA: hypothetical protein [Caudoviricetes sp.]
MVQHIARKAKNTALWSIYAATGATGTERRQYTAAANKCAGCGDTDS